MAVLSFVLYAAAWSGWDGFEGFWFIKFGDSAVGIWGSGFRFRDLGSWVSRFRVAVLLSPNVVSRYVFPPSSLREQNPTR